MSSSLDFFFLQGGGLGDETESLLLVSLLLRNIITTPLFSSSSSSFSLPSSLSSFSLPSSSLPLSSSSSSSPQLSLFVCLLTTSGGEGGGHYRTVGFRPRQSPLRPPRFHTTKLVGYLQYDIAPTTQQFEWEFLVLVSDNRSHRLDASGHRSAQCLSWRQYTSQRGTVKWPPVLPQ